MFVLINLITTGVSAISTCDPLMIISPLEILNANIAND